MLFLTLQLVLNSEDTTVLIDRPDEAPAPCLMVAVDPASYFSISKV